MFYDTFKLLCESNEKTPSAIAEEIGISKSNVSSWKKRGYTPRSETLKKIADYFRVPVEYLLGEDTLREIQSGGIMYSADGFSENSSNDIERHFAKHGTPVPAEEEENAAKKSDKGGVHMASEISSILSKAAALAAGLGASKLVLYGSRARGDARERSDIDLAVYGLPEAAQARFLDGLDNLPTLLDFDTVFVSERTDSALLKNIEKDGVSLMGNLNEKYGKFALAVNRLEEGIADYERLHLDTVRDGVIQRFEFCTELAWKTTREYLIDQGHVELNSPKAVMRQAYADGLVSDGDEWVSLLNDRNLTSHIYDNATAAAVFGKIVTLYLPLFKSLLAELKK